jgi:rare lipoprotein A
MSSRKNYMAVGIASWYGTKFDKRRTSSGERYNMLAMTAAHRTLPLPTYLQVTNLENGKHVIVKVNDRGPFDRGSLEPNRLIDLSFAAAKKIGMSGRGTALVEIKAIEPGVRDKPTTFFAAHKKHPLLGRPEPLYLEVAQYKERAHATHLQQRLAKMFNNHIHVKSLAQGPRVIYQVQIGPIKDKRAADHIRSRLKSIGLASKKVAYDF